MTTIVETYTTANKMTKSGKPLRWRWRIFETNGEEAACPHASSRHSFPDEKEALNDVHEKAVGLTDGVVLRRPERGDVAWRPRPLVVR